MWLFSAAFTAEGLYFCKPAQYQAQMDPAWLESQNSSIAEWLG